MFLAGFHAASQPCAPARFQAGSDGWGGVGRGGAGGGGCSTKERDPVPRRLWNPAAFMSWVCGFGVLFCFVSVFFFF